MAVKEDIISSNPCEDVILPNESYMVRETMHQYSLSDTEIKKFREAALEKCKTGEYRNRNAIVLLIILISATSRRSSGS